MGKHSGKVAVITGGSSGIGLATAKRLVAEGAFVYITGRRQAQLDQAVKMIGNNVTAVQGDVVNLADLDRLYAVIGKEQGHIDILFANAGFGTYAPLGAITEEEFDSTFALNVKSVLFTVQKALPLMREGGSIILNASIAGSKGIPEFSVYGATKAAVRSFARSWALDLKNHNIRVNAVSPGPINTPAHELSTGSREKADALKETFANSIPLGRLGEPDEVARVVSFLASTESSFITGADLVVDGGVTQV